MKPEILRINQINIGDYIVFYHPTEAVIKVVTNIEISKI